MSYTKEERKTYKAAYRAEHKEEIKAYEATYYAENKNKKKTYYVENKEKIKSRQESRREKKKEEIKTYNAVYYAENKEKLKAVAATWQRTIKGKHSRIKIRLKKECVPLSDPLWDFNYYSKIIENNECHYCGGPLPQAGHGLDRKENTKHTADNIVPCCRDCNTIKSNRFSFEEMMMVAPALKQIRSQREERNGLLVC
jgi:5-methylcytosine-specific restriction endonuclease McrA